MSTARLRALPQSSSNTILTADEVDIDDDDDEKDTPLKKQVVYFVFVVIAVLFIFKDSIRTIVSPSNKAMNFKNNDLGISDNELVSNAETIQLVNSAESSVERNLIKSLKENNAAGENVASDTSKLRKVALPQLTVDQQVNVCDELTQKIRSLKQSGVVIETDQNAKALIVKLQTELKQFFHMQYGPNVDKFEVEMQLEFPSTMPDFIEAGKSGKIVIETAPISLVPYSVYMFLQIVKRFKSGAFHRNAGHVLQAMVNADGVRGMAFQEYHPDFPHKRLTMGYAGRPGGPAFYISTVDNTRNHGPGSQGSHTEADGCFGRVVEGEDVVLRMQKQPGKTKPSGFVDNSRNFIKILSLKVL